MSGRELNEPLLPDNYPVYAGYFYVADGQVIVSDWHETDVRHLKHHLKAKEIRRCDIYGRRAALDATPSPPSHAGDGRG